MPYFRCRYVSREISLDLSGLRSCHSLFVSFTRSRFAFRQALVVEICRSLLRCCQDLVFSFEQLLQYDRKYCPLT